TPTGGGVHHANGGQPPDVFLDSRDVSANIEDCGVGMDRWPWRRRRLPQRDPAARICTNPTWRIPRSHPVTAPGEGSRRKALGGNEAAPWAEALRHLVPGGAQMGPAQLELAAHGIF